MKKLVSAILLSSIAMISVNAHEIWLELDNKKDEAKLYFGDFANKQTESGKKFERINEGTTYPVGLVKEVKKNDGDITYTLTKRSDMVAVRTSEPRKEKDSEILVNKVSYSKAGRATTQAITAFDIVPVKENGNTFKLIFNNEAVKKSKIVVTSPSEWEKTFTTDDKGEFTIHTPWIGTYLLEAKVEDETKGEIDGKTFDKTVHTLTYTINESQGLPWNQSK